MPIGTNWSERVKSIIDFKINVITSQVNVVRKQEASSVVRRLFAFFKSDFILFYGPLHLR